ncbi:hypothetical protein [Labrys neptuniae]
MTDQPDIGLTHRPLSTEALEPERMHKHIAIVRALAHLRDRLGDEAFQLVDHWEGDDLATGIASPQDANRLVYIACPDALPSAYTAILERASSSENEIPFEECGSFEGLDVDGLVDVVSVHLQRRK